MTNIRLASSALLSAAIALSSAACSDAFGDQYREEVHTHVSTAPAVLHVDNPVGKVTIQAWDRPSVQIDAVKRGPSADAVHSITISVEPDGNTLNVTTNLGNNSNRRSIDFTIHAPASSDLNIEANVGEVDLEGFTHNVDVDADVGTVTIGMARLGSGQHVTVQSSVGSLNLTLPHNASARISASTSIGNIDGNIPLSLDRHTVGADGSATVGAGAATVHLTASTGSIHIDNE